MIPRQTVLAGTLFALLFAVSCISTNPVESQQSPPVASAPTGGQPIQALPTSETSAQNAAGALASATVVLTIGLECDGGCACVPSDIPTLIAYADGTVLLPDRCSNQVSEGWVDPEWLRRSVSAYFDSPEAETQIWDLDGANTLGIVVADGGSEILTFYPESGAPLQSRGNALGTEDQFPQYFPADQLLARRALRAELESIRAAVSTPVRWDPEFVTIRKVNTADISWEVVNTWPSSATAELRAFLQADGFCLQSSNADVVALLKSPEFRPAASLWTIDGDQVALELHPVLPGYSAC